MSSTLLVTCRICERLHVPSQPLALHPICAGCAQTAPPLARRTAAGATR